MTRNLKASILIASYNYASYVRDSIESALAQDYKNLEIVVTDDGSTDGSADIIKSFEPRIKAVYKKNGGLASSFNSGVKNSTGDILFFLDADDMSDRTRISRVMDQYEANSEAQWVFHRLRRVAKDGHTPVAPEPTPEIRKFDLRNKDFKFPALSTSGLSFRRSFASRVFPMPEAPGQLIHDNYVKFAAVLLAPGIYMGEALGSLRIHGLNDSSGGQPLPRKLHCDIMMALELHRRHPELSYFTDKLASGTAASALAWGAGSEQVKDLFSQYLREVSYPARVRMLAGIGARVVRNYVVGPTEQTHGTALQLSS
jgi:glycosyltransferase involved in cell wall biosynthesis